MSNCSIEFTPLRLDANFEPVSTKLIGEMALSCAQNTIARMGPWNTVTALENKDSDIRLIHCSFALAQCAIILALHDKEGRCMIGPNVTNAVTESPLETAKSLISAEQYLPGRIWCGIGSGDSAVRNVGLKPMSAIGTVDAAVALKHLLTEGWANWQGRDLSLAPAKQPIPVLVAAHGPRMLAAAAKELERSESGIDGLILGTGISADAIAFVENTLPCNIRNLEISWNPAAFDVLDEPNSGEEDILFTIAQACHHFAKALGNEDTPPEFFPREYKNAVLFLDSKYPITNHGTMHTDAGLRRSLADNVLAQGVGFVSYMKERCLVVGTHDQVVRRLSELYERGVRTIQVSALGEPARIMRAARAVAEFNERQMSALAGN